MATSPSGRAIRPGIGLVVFLVLGLMPGTKGPNRFGEAPIKIRLNPDNVSS